MSEKNKRKVLSQTLENVRRGIEKTEFEPAEGVTADAIDGAEATATLLRSHRSAKQRVASKLTPTPKKLLKPLARRLPPAELATLLYETATLINSEEAREKAKEQANVMEERGYSAEGIGKNALQGLLDPAGTIYAAGDALLDPNTWRGFGEFLTSGSRSPRERNRRRGRR